MNSNIDIPAADVAVVVFSAEGVDYFGFLKLNYKTSYTHATKATETGEKFKRYHFTESDPAVCGTEAF